MIEFSSIAPLNRSLISFLRPVQALFFVNMEWRHVIYKPLWISTKWNEVFRRLNIKNLQKVKQLNSHSKLFRKRTMKGKVEVLSSSRKHEEIIKASDHEELSAYLAELTEIKLKFCLSEIKRNFTIFFDSNTWCIYFCIFHIMNRWSNRFFPFK